ncbi:MAG: hypothetical protein ABIL68_11830 [bacterium]
MALKKSEKRLLGLLGVVVIVFLFNQFVLSAGKNKTDGGVENQSNTRTTALLNTGATGESSVANAEFRTMRFDSWGGDPFTHSALSPEGPASSTGNKNTKQSNHVLKGIIWKKGKAFVLVGDQILGEGEEHGGLRIESVDGTEVLCRQGGRSFTLHWRESQ